MTTPDNRASQRKQLPSPERVAGTVKDYLRRLGFHDVNLYKLQMTAPIDEPISIRVQYTHPMVYIRGEFTYGPDNIKLDFYREIQDEQRVPEVLSELGKWVEKCQAV